MIGSVARGVAIALAIAIVGAVALVVIGGVLSVTTGLVVVAGRPACSSHTPSRSAPAST